jgi:hypothetical protein
MRTSKGVFTRGNPVDYLFPGAAAQRIGDILFPDLYHRAEAFFKVDQGGFMKQLNMRRKETERLVRVPRTKTGAENLVWNTCDHSAHRRPDTKIQLPERSPY